MENAALVLVDLQYDFLPGGALAVAKGDEVLPVAVEVSRHFDHIIATQDWHPANHASFAANHDGCSPGEVIDLDGLEQVLWPTHCVQGTRGAELAEEVRGLSIEKIFQKGTDPRIDSYSGFADNGHRKRTGLADYLQSLKVRRVHVMGLATDYCVKFTALDAIAEGFEVSLIEDGCRGVGLAPDDVAQALESLEAAGVERYLSPELG